MNQIDVLLIDGAADHYIVPVSMLAQSVTVDGDTYIRTNEVLRVEEKNRGFCTYRVYRASYPLPQLLDTDSA